MTISLSSARPDPDTLNAFQQDLDAIRDEALARRGQQDRGAHADGDDDRTRDDHSVHPDTPRGHAGEPVSKEIPHGRCPG